MFIPDTGEDRVGDKAGTADVAADGIPQNDPLVIIGRFTGFHGVRGALRVHSYTTQPADIFAYQPWLVSDRGDKTSAADWQEVRPVMKAAAGPRLIAALPGIGNREAAERYIHYDIAVRRSDLPTPEEGRFYWCDLIGLAVYDAQRGFLGRVSHIMPTGSNDVLCVRDDSRESLIPWLYGKTVRSVDLSTGRIDVEWQEPE